MNFLMHRNRTLVNTSGLSIEMKKGQLQFVPKPLWDDVIAAGGIPESELDEDEKPIVEDAPATAAEREAAIFKVFSNMVLKNETSEFTAGGAPHVGVVTTEVGFAVNAKERDALWVKFQQTNGGAED